MKLPPASTWRFRSLAAYTFGNNMTETCTFDSPGVGWHVFQGTHQFFLRHLKPWVPVRSFSNSSRISCSRYRNVFSRISSD